MQGLSAPVRAMDPPRSATHNAVVADKVVPCQGRPQPDIRGHGEGEGAQEGGPALPVSGRGVRGEQQLQTGDRSKLGVRERGHDRCSGWAEFREAGTIKQLAGQVPPSFSSLGAMILRPGSTPDPLLAPL